MEIRYALNVLGLLNTRQLNKKLILKSYREKMKKHHPDKGGNLCIAQELNEAKETAIKFYNETEMYFKDRRNSDKVCIPLGVLDLVSIYAGEEIDIKEYKVSKSNLSNYNIIVLLECFVIDVSRGLKLEFSSASKKGNNDVFSIRCRIPDTSLLEKRELHVELYGKKMKIELENGVMQGVFKFDYNVVVKVALEKILVSEGDGVI